jgi:hypothetical protein
MSVQITPSSYTYQYFLKPTLTLISWLVFEGSKIASSCLNRNFDILSISESAAEDLPEQVSLLRIDRVLGENV